MGFIDRIKRLLGASGGSPASEPGTAPIAAMPAREMISCEEALSLVYEYLDGELEDVSAERARVHFDVCQRCYPHLKLEESFQSALNRAAENAEAAPDELRARIMDVLAGESA